MYRLTEKKIIIYGAASYGKRIYQIFSDNGYEIMCFIDKRADELIEFLGKKVILPSAEIDESVVVFIAVKNVFEHSKIVQDFLNRGIRNIVFRPYAVLMGRGNDVQQEINRVYDCIEQNRFDLFERIPTIKDDAYFQLYDASLVCKERGTIVAKIPWQLIFTNRGNNIGSIWRDINVSQQFPHISFFLDLLGRKENGLEEYLNFCISSALSQGDINITEAWKENVLANREMVFQQMNMAYELDASFFIRNAPGAEWNSENGYFNLTGGKHRAAYLFAKGNKYIPLRISEQDYEKFANQKLAEDVYQSGDTFYGCRILNPYFLQMSNTNGDFYDQVERVLYDKMSRIIYKRDGKITLQGLSFLIDACDDGSLSRTFSKCGMQVKRVVLGGDEDTLQNIDYLMHCTENIETEYSQSRIEDKRYDFVLVRRDVFNLEDVEILRRMSNIATFIICERGTGENSITSETTILEKVCNLQRLVLYLCINA